ncbi:Hypothetical predicted protein [Mytilus galloprovincialis]|uniref:Uncharacterized protein n=2 Tax=Mytilus galloprovincialis TaxID=29158 RepID=A0A8B6GRE9_MYTGA|nr:Hypothetical predicted protein [Mytilus galloprovincialis]
MKNSYVHQKTGSQGSLTTALLVSNVSLMKNLLQTGKCGDSDKCIAGVTLLCVSILLQVAAGIMLVILAPREQKSSNLKKKDRQSSALETEEIIQEKANIRKSRKILNDRINTTVLILTFLIAVINIVINGIGI